MGSVGSYARAARSGGVSGTGAPIAACTPPPPPASPPERHYIRNGVKLAAEVILGCEGLMSKEDDTIIVSVLYWGWVVVVMDDLILRKVCFFRVSK